MNGKSMGMLVAAVLCGLGAMYGTTKLIGKGKAAPVVEMQDVLVASRDLKVEEMIKPEVVKVVRMAKSAVPAGAFSAAKDVEERWAQVAVLEGEPIIDRKLAVRGTPPGLVARIPKGMRAFAIEVNEQSGVSGFILPDHRVDVVQIEPGSNGQPEADTVLQDVLVLASGVVFTRPDDRSIQSRTVTVAVTPEQVDTLVSARSRGTLTLALRGLNDHVQSTRHKEKKEKQQEVELDRRKKDAEPKPAAVVVQAPPPPPPPPPPPVVVAPKPAPPPPPRYITVYRGHDNMRRHRIDLPPDLNPDEFAAPAETTAAADPKNWAPGPARAHPARPAPSALETDPEHPTAHPPARREAG